MIVQALATGGGMGFAVVVTYWALTSARDLVQGFLEKRWPATFAEAEPPCECGHPFEDHRCTKCDC